ncbi:flavin reductase family protein [Solicola sp. PLA-1-18]|uniref:flavin reductase family protein n=1 Tax=Solicola sp. PLA-1-18 TaxID=3380532 RepID=UPI003B7933AE
MTIHTEHPFLPADGDRDPLRRFRGRTPSPVTVWTAGEGRDRAGLTVSSFLVADGDPSLVLGLVDEDSDLADAVEPGGTIAVSLLAEPHRGLAEVFAGQAPAPGGTFTVGTWEQTTWGPVLVGAAGWIGARLVDAEPRHAGWALLLEAVVEHVEVAGDVTGLAHVRGRYRDLG